MSLYHLTHYIRAERSNKTHAITLLLDYTMCVYGSAAGIQRFLLMINVNGGLFIWQMHFVKMSKLIRFNFVPFTKCQDWSATRGTHDMHQVWLDLFMCSFTQNASAICKEVYGGSLVMKGSICITVLKTGDRACFNLALIMQEQIKLSVCVWVRVCIRCDLSYEISRSTSDVTHFHTKSFFN